MSWIWRGLGQLERQHHRTLLPLAASFGAAFLRAVDDEKLDAVGMRALKRPLSRTLSPPRRMATSASASRAHFTLPNVRVADERIVLFHEGTEARVNRSRRR